MSAIGLDFGTSLGTMVLLILTVELDVFVGEGMLSASPFSHEKAQDLVASFIEEWAEKLWRTQHNKWVLDHIGRPQVQVTKNFSQKHLLG